MRKLAARQKRMTTFSELANPGIDALLTYEPGRPMEEVARELGFESADDVDKLASNENALGPSPRAVEAMRESASEMYRYPDGGAFYLKRAISEQLGVEPAQLLMCNGSNEAIELIGHVFLGPDAGIVMSDCAFVVYRLIAAGCRAECVSVPMKGFTHDLDAMPEAIGSKTRVIFVANPNNPTGTMVDSAAIDRFVEAVPDNVVICFDEAYVELLDPALQPDTLRYVREGRNVIVLRTFSKAYGLAGLRIGYAVAPESCIALLNKIRQPFNVNAMALAAAEAALADSAHVERTRELVRDGLDFLVSGFRELGLEYVPSVVNFILVKVGAGREIFRKLQREGVIVRPMDVYGLPEYVRVTVGTDEQNRRFVEALSRVTGGVGRGE